VDGKRQYPEFQDQVALGLVPGFTVLRKFGMNDAVNGSGTTEDIWPIGTVRVLPSAAAVVSVTSSSAADTLTTGAGAWTLTIEGLDANYLEISETINLNGTNAVTTSKSFLRLNRMYVATASPSATQTNVGNITATIGGVTQGYVEADEGQTHQTLYTVPANKYFVIKQYRIKVGRMAGATDCQIEGQVKTFGGAWRSISDVYLYGPDEWVNDFGATVIPPKTEMRVQATSSGATEVSAVFAGYLIEAEKLTNM
jgi:hypothetical protein